MTIYARSLAFRTQLLAGEVEAQRRLAQTYAESYQAARREMDALAVKIAARKKAGQPITRSWLVRTGQLERLQAQLAQATAQTLRTAPGLVSGAQSEAIRQATAHAAELVRTGRESLGQPATFAYANLGAVRSLTGFLGDGSLISAAIQSAAGESAGRVQAILTEGLALGQNPRTIARLMKEETGVPAARAATIARTEILRSYNAATLDNYRANDDVLEGWQWLATLDRRTCALCWAMHGTLHPLSEDFGSHPNCRCTPIPAIIGSPNRIETGAAKFARQPEDVQREVLGPKTLALYQGGRIGLDDVVRREDDPVWGPTLKRVPYAELSERQRLPIAA